MKLLPLARLLRLPNVFTAFADIALGLCATWALAPAAMAESAVLRGAMLLLASGCLYLAGMVWNDYFDLEEDRRDRPFRPLASGQITIRTAMFLGSGLLLAGIGFAALAGLPSAIVAGSLALAILAYDARIKRTPFGPLSMALCRFLNILLGLSLANWTEIPAATRVHLALTTGLYIVGVTWFARTEEKRSDSRVLIRAAVVMLVAGGLALAVATRVKPGTSSVLFPYLLIALGFWIGTPVVRAIRQPTPGHVQAGVKRSVLGLVLLDAVLATAFVGTPGLLIGLLLPPALLLGKWVYST
jgi:4-hydroxybenzoate polyprenyltransferase